MLYLDELVMFAISLQRVDIPLCEGIVSVYALLVGFVLLLRCWVRIRQIFSSNSFIHKRGPDIPHMDGTLWKTGGILFWYSDYE